MKSIAILLGLLSALFFAVTFVLNRLMSVDGGHWIWSSSLRFFWTIPFLLILVRFQKELKPLLIEMRKKTLLKRHNSVFLFQNTSCMINKGNF